MGDSLILSTPLGSVTATFDTGDTLTALTFTDAPVPTGDPASSAAATNLADRLAAYFDGDLEALRGIHHRAAGTEFQTAVWSEVARIPPGALATYAQIAERIGRPKAVRAVGAAIGKNPLALVIPCHRVVGRSGELTGYAWGLSRKRRLLQLEGARAPQLPLWITPDQSAPAAPAPTAASGSPPSSPSDIQTRS